MDTGLTFWTRLINWSLDRRLRLGPMTYDLVAAHYADGNWQAFDPPACPPQLGRPARRAIYQILARVLSGEESYPVLPLLSPRHREQLVEEAIANDCVVLGIPRIMAIATLGEHWTPRGDLVEFDPPPPQSLPLIVAPGQEIAAEVDYRIAGYFEGRRLTIVGGRVSRQVTDVLSERFGINDARWIEADGMKQMRLEVLDGVRAGRDVVVCVTGYIAHADSEKVVSLCRKRNVEAHLVERRREIVGLIESTFGWPSLVDSPRGS